MIQVFLNLIINAVQHVPDGGLIRIVSADQDGGIAVRVEDDGPGIPARRTATGYSTLSTPAGKAVSAWD